MSLRGNSRRPLIVMSFRGGEGDEELDVLDRITVSVDLDQVVGVFLECLARVSELTFNIRFDFPPSPG